MVKVLISDSIHKDGLQKLINSGFQIDLDTEITPDEVGRTRWRIMGLFDLRSDLGRSDCDISFKSSRLVPASFVQINHHPVFIFALFLFHHVPHVKNW